MDDSDEERISVKTPEPSLVPRIPLGRRVLSTSSAVAHTVGHHFKRHAGAGVMASVAYFDPLVVSIYSQWFFLIP